MANSNKAFLGRRGRLSGGVRRNPVPGMAGNSALKARMSRGQFLRTAGIAGAGIGAAAMGLGGVSKAQIVDLGGGSCKVYPTGVYPDDMMNVQEAFDNYNNVLLKATLEDGVTPQYFDFGINAVSIYEPNSVWIGDKSINASGETVNGHMTTIKGGTASFFVYGSWDDMPNANNPAVSFSNIRFEDSVYFSIVIYNDFDVTIDGCKFLNTYSPLPNDTVMSILSHQSGKLTVKNCNIQISDNTALTLQGICYYGFYPWWFGAADVDIQNNTIMTPYAATTAPYPDLEAGPYPSYAGIVAVEPFVTDAKTYFGEDVYTKATIKNNPSITGESGILCCGMNGNSEISGNHIYGAKYMGLHLGWKVTGERLNNATVSGNHIQMAGDIPQYGLLSTAINVFGDANDVHGNVISGDMGNAGLLIYGSGNTVQGNNYAAANLPGWSASLIQPAGVSLTGIGCVLSWFGSMKNVFNESLFPYGTNACNQVLDLGAANDVLVMNKNVNCNKIQDTAILRQYFNEHRMHVEDILGRFMARVEGTGHGYPGFVHGLSRRLPPG